MHRFRQRLARLEKVGPAAQVRCNPEYLAAISNDDLEFVAALPVDDEEGDLLSDFYARMTNAERARLDDICRRMNHGPDA